jgi:hypothetical protein
MIRGKAGQDADRIDWDIVRAELVSCRAVPAKITSARGEVVSDALTARNPLSSPGDPLTGLY